MFAKEREEKILSMLEKNSAVTTAELVELFGVSVETVRKDLLSMEGRGLLRRVHGGAMKAGPMINYQPLNMRFCERAEEKRELSERAVSFVSEGDTIAIDAGSTAQVFAEELAKKFEKLTVVTHCLDVFNVLIKKPSFDVILIGGDYVREENSFVGMLALEMLKSIHVKSSFVCPYTLSLDVGIADFNRELAEMQKQLLSISDEVLILADSGKFEKHALVKVADMKKSYTYITDSSLSEELYTIYTEAGYKICK